MIRNPFVLFFLICTNIFPCSGQIVCTDFTITGTVIGSYFPSQDGACAVSPVPVGQIYWTQSVLNGFPNGFLKHTFNSPQTNVSIWYTILNSDDFASITVNGGGIITLSLVSGCANLTGNILGPYTGTGYYGDVLVNIQSTVPFTEVTLVDTGGQSGTCTGDCSSVIMDPIIPCALQLGNDTLVCQGETIILDAATTNATYLWQDNSTNSTFVVTQEGTYWAEVTFNDCITTDTIDISMENCDIILEIPNVFTPNQDGTNDFFVPVISKGIVSMHTIIYNRWGNIVFETTSQLIEWDGTDVTDGVYFWMIDYTDIEGNNLTKNGYVTFFK